MSTIHCRHYAAKALLAAVSASAVLVALEDASGATRSWINPNGGTFSQTSNWSGGLVPGAADKAQYNLANAAGYSVLFTADASTGSLTVLNDNVTLNLNGHTYALGAPAGSPLVVGGNTGNAGRLALNGGTLSGLYGVLGVSEGAGGSMTVWNFATLSLSAGMTVGAAGAGSLSIVNGGRLATGAMLLAESAGSSGSVSVNGIGAIWNNAGALIVGNAGTGSVWLGSGGSITTGPTTLGNYAGSSGMISLAGGTLSAGSLALGASGSGVLSVASSAGLTTDGAVIGSGPTGSGTGTVSGGTWSTGTLVVGGSGAGRLGIDGAGAVVSGSAMVGSASGSNGTISIGGNAHWSCGGPLIAGGGGNGTVSLCGGASFSTASASIGFQSGSTGVVSLSGPGAAWHNAGSLSVGGGGVGSLLVGPGATLNNGPASVLSVRQLGEVELNGGTISTGTMSVGAGGVFRFSSGALKITGTAGLTIGSAGPLGAIVPIESGRTLRISQALSIDPGGLLVTRGGSAIAASISNAGEILLDSVTSLLEGSLSNSGLIHGDGRITGGFVNAGSGQIRVESGQRIAFIHDSSPGANSGQISLFGGTLEIKQALQNNAGGRITGRGTLIARSGLTLNSGGTLALSAGQSDILGAVTNNGGSKVIVTGGAVATFHDSVTNLAGGEFRVSADSTAVFLGPVTNFGQFTGPGTRDFEGGAVMGSIQGGGSTIVGPGAVVTSGAIRESSLLVEGVMCIAPDGSASGTSRIEQLTIAGAPGAWLGQLDLNDNDLVIDYAGPSPLAMVRDQIRGGSNNSAWNGKGITSSLASANLRLGYAEAAALGRTSFSGQTVDATAVLVKFTYGGDSNLDGKVDVGDLGNLASNWQQSASWTGGDFDYSGTVNVGDLGILATNWQKGVTTSSFGPSLDEALASLGLAGQAVPEPALLGSAILGTLSLHCRRRGMRC